MGIPSFFVHAVRTYKSIVKPISSLGVPVSNLYLDCNGLIYNAVRDVKLPHTSANRDAYESAIISYVCDSISGYVKTVSPTHSVFIAFDGVAPSAKLNQQRERRFKTWLSTAIENDHTGGGDEHPLKPHCADKVPPQKLRSADVWSTACITPGTEFMNKLHTEMTRYTAAANQTAVPQYILSTSNDPGEGEHKLFEHIRANPEQHRDQVTLVYGLDADLIMLTLNHLHISSRIFLYRETPEFIRSVDSSLRPNEQYYVDIPYMADCIARHITVSTDAGNAMTKAESPIDPVVRKYLVYDYIFMFFMMGNDFMPHFPSMNIRTNGPTTVMDAYRTVFKNSHELVEKQNRNSSNRSFIVFHDEGTRPQIDWANVRTFVEHLAASEHDRLIGEHALRNKKRGGHSDWERVHDMTRIWGDNYETAYELIVDKCETSEQTLHLPATERGLEYYIDPTKPNWERRYYHALFDEPVTDKRCKAYCMNYLEGLEWTFSYYTYGCVDWKWKYEYMYPPLLQDLVRFIPTTIATATAASTTTVLLQTQPKSPITPIEQLQYVLPPALQRALIPGHLHSSGNDTDEQVKRGLVIKWAYCKYFWEAHLHY
jgi:5'-3' exonuclease